LTKVGAVKSTAKSNADASLYLKLEVAGKQLDEMLVDTDIPEVADSKIQNVPECIDLSPISAENMAIDQNPEKLDIPTDKDPEIDSEISSNSSKRKHAREKR
jgi:hypothetical protein